MNEHLNFKIFILNVLINLIFIFYDLNRNLNLIIH